MRTQSLHLSDNMSYTCKICSVTLGDQEMLKHVSSTRHKVIIYNETNEEIQCENCNDNNLHMLVIVRYGGSDMVLLCESCLLKEKDKPSIQHSLSNGSFFKMLPLYVKFRDIECLECGNEENLNLAKSKDKEIHISKDYIVCDDCIRKFEYDKNDSLLFISENSDDFLFEFLGLHKDRNADRVKPNSRSGPRKFGKRRIGRGKGKGEGKGKVPGRGKKIGGSLRKQFERKQAVTGKSSRGNSEKPSKVKDFVSPESTLSTSLFIPPTSSSSISSNGDIFIKSESSTKVSQKGTQASKINSKEKNNSSKKSKNIDNRAKANGKENSKLDHTQNNQNEGVPIGKENNKGKNVPKNKPKKDKKSSTSRKDTYNKAGARISIANGVEGNAITILSSHNSKDESRNDKSKNISIPSVVDNVYVPNRQIGRSIPDKNNKPHQLIMKNQNIDLQYSNTSSQYINHHLPVQPLNNFNNHPVNMSVNANFSYMNQHTNSMPPMNATMYPQQAFIPLNSDNYISTNPQSNTPSALKIKEKNDKKPKKEKKEKEKKEKERKGTKERKERKEKKEKKEKSNKKKDFKLDEKDINMDSVSTNLEMLVDFVSKKPKKFSYDSLDEYFNEMCYSLYLEELYENNPIEKFYIEWWDNKNQPDNGYTAVLSYNDEMNSRLSRKMQALRKTPFSVNQTFILNQGLENVWYGYVESVKPKTVKNYTEKVIMVKVILYPWSKKPLPTGLKEFSSFNILPCNATTTRIMFAMNNLKNPQFISLVLGKMPIRQIEFNNYVKYSKPDFNDSQKLAIQSTLNNSITVLQGPPGTGKTSTIVEIILQLLDNYDAYPILVVAASNIAIDNIAEKLLANYGDNLLRIVSNEKEKEYDENHMLGKICLHYKLQSILPPEMVQVKEDLATNCGNVSQNQFKKLLYCQTKGAERLIANSKVIFTTTVVAGSNVLKNVDRISVVIMDEATQSSEPTTLIPLSMSGVRKFIFVGDQNQLSSFSKVSNLELSLFERILKNGTYKKMHMLDRQYRMHPLISEFPRNKFYEGKLLDGITAEQRTHPVITSPLVFWDTNGQYRESVSPNHQFNKGIQRFQKSAGYSYNNIGEAFQVIKVLKNLVLQKKISKEDIGVITPYRAQRDILSEYIASDLEINPSQEQIVSEVDKDDIFADNKNVKVNKVSGLLIASVDAFQGREKDFIIFSCVRSNPENNVGFVKDVRRLNVALTRARYGLILIGDAKCLQKGDSTWNEYITLLRQKGFILKGDEFYY